MKLLIIGMVVFLSGNVKAEITEALRANQKTEVKAKENSVKADAELLQRAQQEIDRAVSMGKFNTTIDTKGYSFQATWKIMSLLQKKGYMVDGYGPNSLYVGWK